MDIKEVEHLDVSKKFSNLIQFSKRFTKLGNKTLKYFKQRLQEKYDYLNRVKKKNSKFIYLKEVKKVKKHDKIRLKKIKKTAPFTLFSSKYFKNTKYIFKQAKPLVAISILNYNRILFVHNIYQKLNKKYYYYNDILKRCKKKHAKIFKLKLHLWKTLSLINYLNKPNYFKSKLLDLDQQLKLIPFIQNNYLLHNKIKIKKKIFNTIFKNNNNLFLKSVYKVYSYNNDIKFYQANFLDNFFYINLNLKNMLINTYYNKIFFFNYDINYFINFYSALKLKFISNIVSKLNFKNYYNFFYYKDLDVIYFKIKKFRKFFNLYSINNIIYKENTNLNLKNKFNSLVKKANYTTIKLMKAKKWTRRSIAKINTKFLKKLIANNARLNMYVNDKTKVKKKTCKVNYFLSSTFFKEEQRPIKIRKYSFYFFNFLKKFSILQQRIVKKYNQYNYKIFNKYNFLVSFFSYYFKQLFYCLKYIFNSNTNNIYLFLLKLKFLLFYIYQKLFLRFIKPFTCSKKKKKLINSNQMFTFNSILYYRKMFKVWLSKKQKEWQVNRYKKKENEVDKVDKYIKPINLFIYNPLLNPRHNLWASRKKQKYIKIYSVIKYKMNGYLRWLKFQKIRDKKFKKHLMWLKRKRRKNWFKKKNKKKVILCKVETPKVIALKKLKKLIKKCIKIWKKKTKIKNKIFRQKWIKIKNKHLFKRNRKRKRKLLKFKANFSISKFLMKKRKRKWLKIKIKRKFKKNLVSFKHKKSIYALYKKLKKKLYRLWVKKLKQMYMRKPRYPRYKRNNNSNTQNKKFKKNYKYKTNIKLK